MYRQSEARCPYCNGVLKKPPQRKAKCPSCGQFYYVRSRPSAAEPVIVTTEEAKAIEDEWEREHYLAEIRRFSPIAEGSDDLHSLALSAAMKQEFDKSWRLFNLARLEAARILHMGIYRNITLGMAQQLYLEGKRHQAIMLLAEVMYYDLCHVMNAGDLSDAEDVAISMGIRHKGGGPFMPFDEASLDDIAPRVAAWFVEWVAEQRLSAAELREQVVTHLRRSVQMRTPLTPEQAWDVIGQLLANDSDGSRQPGLGQAGRRGGAIWAIFF